MKKNKTKELFPKTILQSLPIQYRLITKKALKGGGIVSLSESEKHNSKGYYNYAPSKPISKII